MMISEVKSFEAVTWKEHKVELKPPEGSWSRHKYGDSGGVGSSFVVAAAATTVYSHISDLKILSPSLPLHYFDSRPNKYFRM